MAGLSGRRALPDRQGLSSNGIRAESEPDPGPGLGRIRLPDSSAHLSGEATGPDPPGPESAGRVPGPKGICPPEPPAPAPNRASRVVSESMGPSRVRVHEGLAPAQTAQSPRGLPIPVGSHPDALLPDGPGPRLKLCCSWPAASSQGAPSQGSPSAAGEDNAAAGRVAPIEKILQINPESWR